MKEKLPKEIVESITHFNSRAEYSHVVDELLSNLNKLEKIDFDDIKNVERRAILYIELANAQYKAGQLSEQEYIYRKYYAVTGLVHDTRWTNRFYDKELQPISDKMKEVEQKYGLKEDEYWPIGEAPQKYQDLNDEYEKVLEDKLLETFDEFGVLDIAELYKKEKSQLETSSEIGRESIFIKDEIKRLKKLADIYEKEASINSEGAAFYSASIMLAAAIEARLIIHCIQNQEKIRKTLLKMGLTNKKLHSKNPLNWKLAILINICAEAGWLINFETERFIFNTKNIAHTLRNTRNLVHPGRHVKKMVSLAFGKEQYQDIENAHKLIVSNLKIST